RRASGKPVQRRECAVDTSCPGRCLARRRSTHSSRNTRVTSAHQHPGFVNRGERSLTGHCWVPIEEIFERFTRAEVVEERSNRDTRAAKDRCPRHDIRV